MNNFESIISAKTVGTQDVANQAEAIRKLADSIEGLGKKADKVNEHPGFAQFAERIKQGIESPLQAIGGASESAIKSLGPLGVAAAGAAAVLAAAGAAGLAFGRELGRLGDGIEDTATRLGITTTEAQQFRYAMKLTGGDIGALEGVMRKLSAEIEGGGANLDKLGVAFRDVRTGAVLPVVDVVTALVGKLKEMPSVTERTAAAVAVLGRGVTETLPDLIEFPEKLLKAQRDAAVFAGSELKAFNELHQEMVKIDDRWDYMVAKLKEGVSIPVIWLFSGLGKPFLESREGGPAPGGAEDFLGQNLDILRRAGQRRDQQDAAQRLLIGQNNAAVAAAQQATDEERLAAARTRLAADLKSLATNVLPEVNAATFKKIEADRADIAGIEGKIKAIKDLEAITKDLAASMAAFNTFDAGGTSKAPGRAERLKQITDPFGMFGQGFRLDETLKLEANLREAMASFDTFDLGGVTKGQSSADRLRGLTNPFGVLGQGFGIEDTLKKEAAAREAAVQSLRMESQFTAQLVELRAGPGGELAAARTVADLREASLKQELEITGDIIAYREESRRNEIAFELKRAELERKRLDERRAIGEQLFDAARGGKDGLVQFGQSYILGQLRTVAGNAFAEVFKNSSMNLGLGGKIFQGTIFGQDPLKGATDMNTLATSQNTQAIIAFNARLAASATGGGGGVVPSLAGYGRFLPGGAGYTGSGEGPEYSGGPSDNFGIPGGHVEGPNEGSGEGSGGFRPSTAQYGTAAVGTGVGIYGAITSPSTKGKLASGGGALMSAGQAVPPPVGPAMMIAGAAMQFASMILGDTKVQRDQELEAQRQARMVGLPQGADYSTDIYGRSVSYDYQGGLRPVVNNYQMTVNAIDPPSFVEWGRRNAAAVAAVVSHAAMNDEQISATLSQVMP